MADSPIHRLTYEFWLRCARMSSGDLPLASAIDPIEMPGRLLPNLMLRERRGPNDYLIRLCGSWVVDVMGFNPTGKRDQDLPGAHAKLARLESCAENRRPYYAECRIVWVEDKRDKTYSTAAFPFVDETGQVTRILSSAEFSD